MYYTKRKNVVCSVSVLVHVSTVFRLHVCSTYASVCLESLCSRKPSHCLQHHSQSLSGIKCDLWPVPSPSHVVMVTMLLKGGRGMARQCMCRGCDLVVEKPAASTIISETLHLLDNNTGRNCVTFLHLLVKKRDSCYQCHLSISPLHTCSIYMFLGGNEQCGGPGFSPIHNSTVLYGGTLNTELLWISQFVQGFKVSIAIMFLMARADFVCQNSLMLSCTQGEENVSVSTL